MNKKVNRTQKHLTIQQQKIIIKVPLKLILSSWYDHNLRVNISFIYSNSLPMMLIPWFDCLLL